MRFRIAKRLLPLLALFSALDAFALGEPKYVEGAPTAGSFAIVHQGAAARIYVDSGDYPGVTRAAGDLQSDISRVTGVSAEIVHALGQGGADAILIGTIGKSAVIDRLIREHKIDVGAVKGKWESTLIQVVERPLPGVKRGTGDCGERQARNDFRHLRSVAADWSFSLVLVGGCSGGAQGTHCS